MLTGCEAHSQLMHRLFNSVLSFLTTVRTKA